MSKPDGLLDKIRILHDYSACDVSDALLKLQKPGPGEVAYAGHLADMIPYALSGKPHDVSNPQEKVIAPISTLKLIDKTSDVKPLSEPDSNAIPRGQHWADLTDSGTILVIEQPSHQKCAAVGGIMAQRMKARGVAGCVIGGRVRDITELLDSELSIWANGKSTVGSGAESKVYGRNVQVSVQGVVIEPGDIGFADPVEGVVVIPKGLLDKVLELMPKLVAADNKVKQNVVNGATVAESFKKYRD